MSSKSPFQYKEKNRSGNKKINYQRMISIRWFYLVLVVCCVYRVFRSFSNIEHSDITKRQHTHHFWTFRFFLAIYSSSSCGQLNNTNTYTHQSNQKRLERMKMYWWNRKFSIVCSMATKMNCYCWFWWWIVYTVSYNNHISLFLSLFSAI